MGQSCFQNHWLQQPEFSGCVQRDSNNVFSAYCHVCKHNFDVKNKGEGTIKSHGTGTKHITNYVDNNGKCRCLIRLDFFL